MLTQYRDELYWSFHKWSKSKVQPCLYRYSVGASLIMQAVWANMADRRRVLSLEIAHSLLLSSPPNSAIAFHRKIRNTFWKVYYKFSCTIKYVALTWGKMEKIYHISNLAAQYFACLIHNTLLTWKRRLMKSHPFVSACDVIRLD